MYTFDSIDIFINKRNNMKKNQIKKRYSTYSNKVQDYMVSIYQFLEDKFVEVGDEWLLSLDMLASNLDVFVQCEKQIAQDGIMLENRFGIMEKHPLLKVQNDSQIQIVKLLNEFGLTLKSLSKIKLDDDTDDDYLEELMN